MREKLQSLFAIAVLGLFPITSYASLINIDTFDDGEVALVGGESSEVNTPAALGGSRYVSVSGSRTRVSVEVDTPDYEGLCSYSSDSRFDGSFALEYGHSADLNADLSRSDGSLRIAFADINPGTGAGSDVIRVTVLAGGISDTRTFVWPASPGDFDIPLASFATITNWSDVDRLTFVMDGRTAADVTIDSITSMPEPVTVFLIMFGGLLYRSRR